MEGEGDVCVIAEVEVVFKDVGLDLLKDLLILALIDHHIEILMFEGDKLSTFDAINFLGV